MSKAQQMLSMIAEGEIFQEGPFVFTTAEISGDKIKGTLAYKGQAFTGSIGFDEDDVTWEFSPALPEEVAGEDAWLDLVDDLLSHHAGELELD